MHTDLSSEIKVLASIDPAAIYNSNGTKTGATIDAAGFDSLTFVTQTGVITDGTWTTKTYGGNASDMSDEAELTGSSLIDPNLSLAITVDSKAVRQGISIVQAGFRYYRCKATQAAATTGGFICQTAILAKPRIAPVALTPA